MSICLLFIVFIVWFQIIIRFKTQCIFITNTIKNRILVESYIARFWYINFYYAIRKKTCMMDVILAFALWNVVREYFQTANIWNWSNFCVMFQSFITGIFITADRRQGDWTKMKKWSVIGRISFLPISTIGRLALHFPFLLHIHSP